MKDKEFRRELSDRREEMQRLGAECRELADRMQALVVKYGEDEKKLKKIPEWNELHAKLTALKAHYEAKRQEQLETVRKRLTPQKNLSK